MMRPHRWRWYLANGPRWWYDPIIPSDISFPFACQQTLTGFLLAVSSHLSRKRPADTFLNFLTNATSIFVVFLSELSNSLMDPGLVELSTSDAVHLYLEENPGSNLANVLNLDEQQKKFRSIAEDILQTFLDTKAYNCEPVKVFLREILAGTILEMTLQSCSKPEWINGWIVYLLEEGEPDIMNAIDAGMDGTTAKEVKNATAEAGLSHSSPINGSHDELSSSLRPMPANHKRKISEAGEAMDQAMLEAKRLSELIAAEDAKKDRVTEDAASSGYATGATATPTSSQSDLHASANGMEALQGDRIELMPQISPSTESEHSASFTNFDQILSPHQILDRSSEESIRPQGPPALTLHNARVTIFDDSQLGEKTNLRSKPMVDYLLQVEPASSQHPGWMIARKYADFETLHEVLRRISVISGVPLFTQRYNAVPTWKGQNRMALCTALEQYLHEALSHSRLAESEGMKRFLEKDQGLDKLSDKSRKNIVGFPSPAVFETMGKGMLDVLVSAPRGAAGGGKMLFEGVSGVFGGQKKPNLPPRPSSASRPGSITGVSTPLNGSVPLKSSTQSHARMSGDSFRPQDMQADLNALSQPQRPTASSKNLTNSIPNSPSRRASNDSRSSTAIESGDLAEDNQTSAVLNGITTRVEPAFSLHLPPLPSEIPDDYKAAEDPARPSSLIDETATLQSPASKSSASVYSMSGNAESSTLVPSQESPTPSKPKKPQRSTPIPLTEQETSVAVELFFAVINELYTLSSAWNIRRTLLNAAKSFLLRPGNPNLEAIRVLLQDTVIQANASDAGLATHLLKLRENALPTEEELAKWPPPLTKDEQEALRVKARKSLIEKGMPQALTSVMGAAATGEALGRVFDALQVQEVGRGLMFALILQAARAVTH